MHIVGNCHADCSKVWVLRKTYDNRLAEANRQTPERRLPGVAFPHLRCRIATPHLLHVAISPPACRRVMKTAVCQSPDRSTTCNRTHSSGRHFGPVVASCVMANQWNCTPEFAVRRFRWLIIALFVLPWLASEAIAPLAATEDMSGSWRRTRQGWQRVECFQPPIPYRRPALHPGVVGALEVLLTMTAMLALSAERAAVHTKSRQTTR